MAELNIFTKPNPPGLASCFSTPRRGVVGGSSHRFASRFGVLCDCCITRPKRVLPLVPCASDVAAATRLVSDTASVIESDVNKRDLFCPLTKRESILESSGKSCDFAEGEKERLDKLSKDGRLDGEDTM